MPHITMKHFPSLSDEQRNNLADIFVAAIKDVVGCPKNVISVAFESIAPEIWMQDVYQNEIMKNKSLVHTFPDYNTFDKDI